MTTSTSALDRTQRRTIRDLLVPRHVLRHLLAPRDAVLRLPVLVQTYARSSHEDGDEWSRTPRRALRQLLPIGGILYTYTRSSNETSALDRTPRRARQPLLPRVERLAAPADHARPVWKSNFGRPTPSTRRRPVTASARWRGGSTPSTRRRRRDRTKVIFLHTDTIPCRSWAPERSSSK